MFALIGTAVVLEAGARLAESIVEDARAVARGEPEEWFIYDADLGWRPRPGYAGEVYGAPRRFDGRGFGAVDGDDLDARGAGKIVLLGDSRTFGNGVAVEATFAEQLEEAIPGASTVSLGVPGYTSYQGRRALEALGAALAPAVVVVAFGYNDRRYVLEEADADGPERFRDLAARAGRAARASRADRSALVRGARRLLGGRDRDSSGPVEASRLRPRVDLAAYEDNLRAIVDRARRLGAKPIVLLLGDHPVAAAPLQAGLGGSVPDLRVAIGLRNPLSELARRELRRVYERTGQEALARPLSVVPVPFRSLHGGDPIEADAVYRDAARKVAGEAGTGVVDGAAILARRPETYTDLCHFDEEGHRLIAEALASAILAPRPGP